MMEDLLSALLALLSLWFTVAFLMIVLPSIFGVSLGISELYIKILVKTLEILPQRSRPEYCEGEEHQK
ncbi:UNVERIFIED_CONTAM: hypothetical protein K2H54_024268 [Gekko kuhli]